MILSYGREELEVCTGLLGSGEHQICTGPWEELKI